jgi:hypothetical protein
MLTLYHSTPLERLHLDLAEGVRIRLAEAVGHLRAWLLLAQEGVLFATIEARKKRFLRHELAAGYRYE